MTDTVHDAERRAVEAKARLTGTLSEFQARLAPRALASDMLDQLDTTTERTVRASVGAARQNPRVAIVAGGLVGLIILRRPIAALLGRMRKRRVQTWDYR